METIDKIDSLLRHVKLVEESTELLGRRLIRSGEESLGILLIANGRIHDYSKFFGLEWDAIAAKDKEISKEILEAAIANHQRTNKHHPEYWGGIDNMPTIFIAEMVCDWKARSSEAGTDLRQWIKDIATKKYDMSTQGKKWKEIKKFVDLLLDEPLT